MLSGIVIFMLLGCFSGLLACLLKSYARKHRVTFYPEARFSDKIVKPTLREYLWMPDWKVASYAGIDAVAYLHSVVYCVFQLLTFLPFLFFGVPFYYRGGDTASTFDRFTISNLHLLDTVGAGVVCSLAVCCIFLYLVCSALRFVHAYRLLERCEICRSWNPNAHTSDGVADAQTECQCHIINPLPKVLMLSGVRIKTEEQLRTTVHNYVSAIDPRAVVEWIYPLRDTLKLLNLGHKSVAKGFSTHLHDVVPVEYSIHAETRDQSNCWPQIFLSRFHPRQYVQMPFRRVRLAPWPSDILWRNLMATRRRSHCWPLGRVVQSVIIFFCCLILSSPSYLLVAMNRYNLLDWLGPKMSVFCYQWIPSLILVVASASVKKLVVVSESWNAHETFGNQEKAGQRNLFAFLVITVLMFPSLGVSGLPALFRWWNDSQEEVKRLRLECTFNPDSSALFINYVITRTAMYSAMTLFQTSRWIIFSLRCLRARSSAELSYFARKFTSPFPYRQRYAYMSLLLSIVIAYAPVAPIILLFGLLYFGCEYFVCKYVMVSLYYVPTTYDSLRNNDPSEAFPDRIYHVSWFIQCTRAGLTGICLACLNLVVFFGLRVKVAQNKTVSYILFTLLIASIIVCILLPWIPDYSCDWLYLLCSSRKDASVLPSQYPHSLAAQELLTPSDDEHPQGQHEYIAPFLRDLVNPSVT